MSTPPSLALPATARRASLRTGRGPLAAILAEPADGAAARGTALLLPGFTGSKEDFLPVLAPLTADGWRVVAVDQRGQYQTPGRPEPSEHDLAALGADARDALAGLAARYGPPVHLLGHSLGGLVAGAALGARTAGAAPVEPVPPVASLTLLCSGPGALPVGRRTLIAALRAALPVLDLEQIWQAKQAMDRDAGVPAPPPDVLAFLHERFVRSSPAALTGMADVLLHGVDQVDGVRAALAGRPVLVAYGAGDDAWPLAEQDAMARRLGTRAVVIPDCAHSPAAEAPQATAALLDAFWTAAGPAWSG